MGSAADLTLRPEGEGADVRRLFSDHATAPARVASGTVVHLLAVAALVLLARMIPEQVLTSVLPRRLPDQLIWLSQPGTSGGGGGGNRTTQPPRQAQVKGTEPVSVPASSEPEPPIVEPVTIPETPPEPAVPLQAQAAGSAAQFAPGDLSARNTPGGDAGPGSGPGAGRDAGPGFGPGERGGPVGPYQVGNGVTPPRLRRKVDPQYSAEAMRAKIQGVVGLSAVVQPDGRVTDIRVIRSLDQSFGLDAKAIDAARRWEFYPGTRFGEPVPVLVNIEIAFNLR